MDHKGTLLDQLRIDRSSDVRLDRTSKILLVVSVIGVIALVGGGASFVLTSQSTTVQATIARAVEPVTLNDSASLLDASGYVIARRQATVSAKVTGKVLSVPIEEGQSIEQGQVMARLDNSNTRANLNHASAQLSVAQATLASAQVAFDNVKPVYDRNVKLHADGWISESALETSQANYDSARTGLEVAKQSVEVARAARDVAQRAEDDMVVRAPFSGVVTVKAAQPGEMVSPVSAGGGFTRTGIGTIVDMDSLEVEVDVSENFISRVHPLQSSIIRLNAYPDWQIPGEVITVIPSADRARATVKVRVALKEKDSRVVPEMGARVSFLSDTSENISAAPASSVVVPTAAVLANGDTGIVYVIKSNMLEQRSVQLGARILEGQTILSGVAPGDRLAMGDLTRLTDKMDVKVED